MWGPVAWHSGRMRLEGGGCGLVNEKMAKLLRKALASVSYLSLNLDFKSLHVNEMKGWRALTL